MERKLVKQGRNALTVTLPARWLRQKGLRAGDSVFIEEENRWLAIKASRAADRRTIELDLRGCERPMMWHVVMGKYIEGYDHIVLLHDSPKVAQEIAGSLIGMVVEQHTAARTSLRSIVAVPEDTFDAVLRRAAHMLVQHAAALVDVSMGKMTVEEIKSGEILLDQQILYCLRYLAKYENARPSYRHFLLCTTLEEAGDQISRLAQHIGRQRTLAQTVARHVDLYATLLFTDDFKRMYSTLRTFRNAIGTKTFADGLAYSLAEILYNYIGYVMSDRVKSA